MSLIVPPGFPTLRAKTQTSTDNSTLIATDAFVQTVVNNAISGVNPAIAVQWATTTAGNTSGLTYNNGASGIGATFTGANNTTTTFDGHTFVVGDVGVTRVLIKNDTQSPSGAYNGVYLFTALHTSITGDVFTRALDYDTPSDMNNTGAIPVVSGTVNGSTTWVLTSQVATVGTTPLTYAQFSVNPANIFVTAGTGLTGTGSTTVALSTPVAPANGGTGVSNSKNLTVSNALTLAGTDSTTMTFPTTSATIARTDAAQTFTGTQTFGQISANLVLDLNNAVSVSSNAGTCSASFRLNTFTNSSAATMAITISTSGATDGQLMIVRVYDFSAVSQTIGWTNTENSTVAAPTASNGSTSLPVIAGFIYNGSTSKWRCIASA